MGAKELEPLYYAMIRLFMDGKERSARDAVSELEADYSGYKLLTVKDMDEALATAKENGLLDESGCDLRDGELVIRYQINDFGRDMVEKYL